MSDLDIHFHIRNREKLVVCLVCDWIFSQKVSLINISALTLNRGHIDGLVQDCSNSIADALKLLQSYTKPSMSFNYRWIRARTTQLQCVSNIELRLSCTKPSIWCTRKCFLWLWKKSKASSRPSNISECVGDQSGCTVPFPNLTGWSLVMDK